MPVSQHPALRTTTQVLSLVAVGFGINALLRPKHALSLFEWDMPQSLPERQLVESLLYIYGVRDIFWGLAIYIASACGTPRSAGWTMLAGSAVAFADGYICYTWGHGQAGHWSYAPIFALVGAALLGVFD